MEYELGKCPNCGSKNTMPLHEDDICPNGIDYLYECEDCDTEITYKLALVDAEFSLKKGRG